MLLQTEDGEVIPVDDVFITHCRVLSSISTQLDYQSTFKRDEEELSAMPLSSVKSPILLLLYQFSSELHAHKGCSCYITDDDKDGGDLSSRKKVEEWIRKEARPPGGLSAHCHQWISDFFSILDQQTLVDFINLSNLLNFPEATELGCKQVALLIKGKNPDEIRTLFNIEPDFTEMELAEMKEQYKWASCLFENP